MNFCRNFSRFSGFPRFFRLNFLFLSKYTMLTKQDLLALLVLQQLAVQGYIQIQPCYILNLQLRTQCFNGIDSQQEEEEQQHQSFFRIFEHCSRSKSLKCYEIDKYDVKLQLYKFYAKKILGAGTKIVPASRILGAGTIFLGAGSKIVPVSRYI